MVDDVREYIATCPVCQGKAIHRHKPYGQLDPLPIPMDIENSPFKEISLDWITGLPASVRRGQEYNSILTVVCRVTKYALFIPTRENTTAVDFAELFFEHVECRFGTPRSIVSDRDSRITSDFWREVCEIKMIKTYVVIALKIIQPGLDYFRLCNIIMAVTRLCNSKSEISSSYLPNI